MFMKVNKIKFQSQIWVIVLLLTVQLNKHKTAILIKDSAIKSHYLITKNPMNLKSITVIEKKFFDLLMLNTEKLKKLQKTVKLLQKNNLNKHLMSNIYLINW